MRTTRLIQSNRITATTTKKTKEKAIAKEIEEAKARVAAEAKAKALSKEVAKAKAAIVTKSKTKNKTSSPPTPGKNEVCMIRLVNRHFVAYFHAHQMDLAYQMRENSIEMKCSRTKYVLISIPESEAICVGKFIKRG